MHFPSPPILRPLFNFGRRLLWTALAALFAVLLFSLRGIESVPGAVTASLFAIAVLSGWRPTTGLTIVAAVVPIASWTGRRWTGTVGWPEAVAIAFLLGYACRQATARRQEDDSSLLLAIHSTIAIVGASLLVQLLVLHGTIGAEALGGRLRELAGGAYFVGHAGVEGLHPGMRLIEGLLLAHAGASLARTYPPFAKTIFAAVVVGAAAAGALNLWRIWLGALRIDRPVATFVRYLATMRFNAHYADVNAAGSYFAMTLLTAIGFARQNNRSWSIAGALIVLSLILSGSRAAFLAIVIAVLVVWWLGRQRDGTSRRPGKRTATLALLLTVLACGPALYLLILRNVTPARTALWIRAEFVRASLRMVEYRPLFGIGVGQYPVRLHEFGEPELSVVFPMVHENAHNNFLQVFAELGIAGFAAFTWVLGVAAARLLAGLRQTPARPLHAGVTAGLLAFVLTWFGGHPLLIDAAAFSFWLLLGAAAGSVTSLAPSSSVGRRSVVVAMLAVAVSVPFRARQEIKAANLENLGIGVSQWQAGSDGIKYRLAGVTSTVFVPAAARAISLPLRSLPSHPEVRIEIYLDGRLADALTVPASAWRLFDIQVPPRDDGRRFRALELRILDGSLDRDAPALMVGKVQPHW
ncbi:hypothetical protein BH18ACI5_BH18ACI5_07410 [soil metagenome]